MEGHRQGYMNLKTIGEAAIERGVKYVSAFCFSTENWQRSREEVNYLMELLYWVASKEVTEIHAKGIKVKFIGSDERLSPRIIKAIRKAEELTEKNTKGTLGLCVNYGGQSELVDAMSRMLADGVSPENVTPELVSKYLYAPDVPNLDLIIRTSGERRISGFMLWRAAYAELLFVDKHWPDFTVADLDAALAAYASRQRRFGK